MTELNDFLDGPKTIAGVTFRPFTMGSKALCEQMNLTLFTTGNLPDGAQDGESDRQIIAFTWIHAAPLSDVLAAVRHRQADAAALEFGFAMPVSSMNAIVREINRISKQAAENAVEVEEKPGSKSDAPGNSVGQAG